MLYTAEISIAIGLFMCCITSVHSHNRYLSTLRMLLATEECITLVMIVILVVIQLASLMRA